jgi:hypothetical protein
MSVVLNEINEFQSGAELQSIALFRSPIIMATEIAASLFIPDDEAHTPKYWAAVARL